MKLGYLVEGKDLAEVVVLASLQARLPGSEIDLDRRQVAVNASGKSVAEVMVIVKSLPGVTRVDWLA